VSEALIDRLRRLGPRSRRALLFSAVVGFLVGCAVAAFDWVTREQLLERFLGAPIVVQAVVPGVGLAAAALALRWMAAGASPATSDDYIENFHDPGTPLDLRPVFGRIAAGVATLGLGGALGFEGPSMYMGASIGSGVQQRWRRWFTEEDSKLLMVAGAAAGVAAIFKSPATGAVFALEVPFQDDTASRLLLPALLGAAVSYLTFAAFAGTTPLFTVAGAAPLDLRDLGGAVVLGVVCGLGARGFSHVVRYAKKLSTMGHPAMRVVLAGMTMAALVAVSDAVYGQGYAFGAGYATIAWVAQPDQLLGLVLLLFAIRMGAVAATLAGGGVGGLFVPLAVAGALAGRAIGIVVGDSSSALFPVLGVAAFLGAGYRTPLAGVIFVAETTGQPGFVVPGLLASVAAQLMMGGVSVSAYQHGSRVGHLDDP
jgi:CIC family chloride channel protein